MLERSNEIIKQLNRLANDHSLSPHTRNKVRDAIQHIKDLHAAVKNIRNLYARLDSFKHKKELDHS